MKKIAINMSHYGQASGYGVVFTNLINQILENDSFEFFLLSKDDFSLPKHLKNKKNINIIISKPQHTAIYRLRTQGMILKNLKIDVFFTCDNIVPIRKYCKYISTIHDLFFYKTFRGFKLFKLRRRKDQFIYHLVKLDKYFVRNSDYVITPSLDTKNDVIKEFGVNSPKVVLAYWGLDHLDNIEENSKQNNQFVDYILFPLCSDNEDHFIFKLGEKIIKENLSKNVVYRNCSSNEGKELPKIIDNRMIIFNKRISDSEKMRLFREAKLCIYISEFEGFGFVPLEILHERTGLVYRDIGCLQEVLKGCGIGIKGFNIDDYVGAIVNYNGQNNDSIKELLDSYKRSKTKEIVESFF